MVPFFPLVKNRQGFAEAETFGYTYGTSFLNDLTQHVKWFMYFTACTYNSVFIGLLFREGCGQGGEARG